MKSVRLADSRRYKTTNNAEVLVCRAEPQIPFRHFSENTPSLSIILKLITRMAKASLCVRVGLPFLMVLLLPLLPILSIFPWPLRELPLKIRPRPECILLDLVRRSLTRKTKGRGGPWLGQYAFFITKRVNFSGRCRTGIFGFPSFGGASISLQGTQHPDFSHW